MADRIDGYAAALFELAKAEGELSKVEREFYSIGRTFASSTELRDTLSDPKLPSDRKQAILDDLVGGRVSGVTVAMLNLVVSQGRAADIPAIAERLAGRAAASAGKQLAEVRSAIELDEATVARLTAALSRAVGTEVEVRTVVDPSVLGGIVATVGDTVIDGTVKRRIESLRTAARAG